MDSQCKKTKGLQASLAAAHGILDRNIEEAEQRLRAAKEAKKVNSHDQASAAETLELLEGQGGKLGEQIAGLIAECEDLGFRDTAEEQGFASFVQRERAETGEMEGVLVGLQAVLAGVLASAEELTRVKKARASARAGEAKELARQAEVVAREAEREKEECEEAEAANAKMRASLMNTTHVFTS